jgi:biopolymer transport protein ExbD
MKVPTRRRQYGLKFDLTPLNDIVFLLIIFLVASPHFKASDAKDEVALPKVDIGRGAETEAERRLEITVTRDGEWRIAGQPLSPDELRRRIRAAADRFRNTPGNYELRLRCDERATWGQVEPIVKMCVEAGITDVKYAVLPAGGK